MRLFLGVGPYPIHPQHLEVTGDLAEWTLVDKYIQAEGVKNWDCETLDEVADGTVEEIYSSHLLEHISHTKTREVLSIWHRKLKDGGKLTLNVPDLEWLCRQTIKYIAGGVIDSKYFDRFEGDKGLLTCFYGSQVHEGEYHKAGFTKDFLAILLKEHFKDIDIQQVHEAHDMGCLIAKCRK